MTLRSPALSTLISLQCLPLCLLTVISGSFQARVRGEGSICPRNSRPHANINHDCLEINFFSRCTAIVDQKIQQPKENPAPELILVMMMLAMMLMSMQSLWPWCRWPTDPPLSCSTRVKRGTGSPSGEFRIFAQNIVLYCIVFPAATHPIGSANTG